MARADAERLKAFAQGLIPSFDDIEVLRNRTGLVMVPMRDTAQGTNFHPILSAGREKRIFAVPPYTKVEPLVFSDVPYKVEEHAELTCSRTGTKGFFMSEIPQDDGSSAFEVSDSEWGVKIIRKDDGEPVELGETWYKNGEMPS